jgi:amino acid transporter
VPETGMADQFEKVGLGWMSFLIYICALVGITVSFFTNFMATVRLVQSFGSDGLMPPVFKTCDPSTGIPTRACYITMFVLGSISFFQDLEQLSMFISLCNLLVYSFVTYCFVLLRYQEPDTNLCSTRVRVCILCYTLTSLLSSYLIQTDGIPLVLNASLLVLCVVFVILLQRLP